MWCGMRYHATGALLASISIEHSPNDLLRVSALVELRFNKQARFVVFCQVDVHAVRDLCPGAAHAIAGHGKGTSFNFDLWVVTWCHQGHARAYSSSTRNTRLVIELTRGHAICVV
jgi:hypothetical protein